MPPPPVLREAARRQRHLGIKLEVGYVVLRTVDGATTASAEVVVGAVPPLPRDHVASEAVEVVMLVLLRLKVGALCGGGGGGAVVAVGPLGGERINEFEGQSLNLRNASVIEIQAILPGICPVI